MKIFKHNRKLGSLLALCVLLSSVPTYSISFGAFKHWFITEKKPKKSSFLGNMRNIGVIVGVATVVGLLGALFYKATRKEEPNDNRTPSRKTRKKKKNSRPSRLFPQPKGKDMVQEMLGVAEEELKENTQKYQERVKQNAGAYHLYNYAQLKESIEGEQTQEKTPKSLGGTGEVKRIFGKSIQQIISEEDLENAAIQSASTRYGLEGGMNNSNALLKNMQYCAVQGETAATCLLWGNIDRKYYRDRQDYLKDVFNYDDNGHIVYPKTNESGQLNYKPNFNNLKIGIQTNTAIAYQADTVAHRQGKYSHAHGINVNFPYLTRTNDDRKTAQIMAFALNFSPKHGHPDLKDKQNNPNLANIAKELLKKQYLMTVWTAYKHNIRDVYLTSLGGGAFANRSEWIREALASEELVNFVHSRRMNVFIVDPRQKRRSSGRPMSSAAGPARQIRRSKKRRVKCE